MAYNFPAPVKETGNLNLNGSSTATIEYIIPWDDLASATSAVLDPDRADVHNTWRALISKSVFYEPVGDYETSDFKNARFIVTYGVPEGGEGGGTGGGGEGPGNIGQVSLSVSGESVTLPRKNFTVGGNALDEAFPNPHKAIPQLNMSLTVHHATALNIDSIGSLIGKVNSTTFLVENKAFAAKSVLFVGCDSDHGFDADGVKEFDIVYHFQVHTQTWNHLWDADSAAWVQVAPDLYETGNFNILF